MSPRACRVRVCSGSLLLIGFYFGAQVEKRIFGAWGPSPEPFNSDLFLSFLICLPTSDMYRFFCLPVGEKVGHETVSATDNAPNLDNKLARLLKLEGGSDQGNMLFIPLVDNPGRGPSPWDLAPLLNNGSFLVCRSRHLNRNLDLWRILSPTG